jgi:hypothetical protein
LGRFLEPFWRPGADGVFAGPLAPDVPAGPTLDAVSDVLTWREWAEDHRRAGAFWHTYWLSLPLRVVMAVRFPELPAPQGPPAPWMALLDPLRALVAAYDPTEMDAAMFGPALRLAPGLDGDTPQFLPCPGDLVRLADQVVAYEAHDPGLPPTSPEAPLEPSDEVPAETSPWTVLARPLLDRRERFYAAIQDQLRQPGPYDDGLRAYCLLRQGAMLPAALRRADHALKRAPDDPHLARLRALIICEALLTEAHETLAGLPADGAAWLRQPIYRRSEHTWLVAAAICSEQGRREDEQRYLLRYHRLFPYLPGPTCDLARIAWEAGDGAGFASWCALTQTLDGEYGWCSQELAEISVGFVDAPVGNPAPVPGRVPGLPTLDSAPPLTADEGRG